jgi:hypothetical protein
MLESRVAIYQEDPIMAKIRSVLDQDSESELKALMEAVRSGKAVVTALFAQTGHKSLASNEESGVYQTARIRSYWPLTPSSA